jgi:hypothetical protein
MSAADHANCSPGCHLHPQLHHSGWAQRGGGKIWHLFRPGITVSECGAVWIEDSMPRKADTPDSWKCLRCLRSDGALKDAIEEDGLPILDEGDF